MIRLRTFGSVALERDGTPLTGRHTQRRRLALLVLLANSRGGPVSRDRLLGLLWPERDADRARHVLAQLVYELRRDLGHSTINGGLDDLSVDPSALTSDVGEFEEALQERAMERVAALYTGPFLDGFFVSGAAEFERWVEERRRELETKYLHALETLAVVATDREDFWGAAEYRRRAAALDPLSTRHALALMQALARAGDRPGAVRHAQIHTQLLRSDLDADADPSIARFAAELSASPDAARAVDRKERVREPAVAAVVASGARSTALASDDAPARENASPQPTMKPGRRFLSLAAAVVLLLLGAVVVRAHYATAAPIVPQEVVLGDIAGPDTVLSLAAREVVRAELERTPDVVVLSDAAVANTLQLMKAPPTSRLTEALADDVALRTGVPFVVVGRAAALGNSIDMVVRLVDPRTGRTIVVKSANPRSNADAVPTVARATAELRERVSRERLPQDAPLPAVTTSSLGALRAYALARAALARVDRPSAIAYAEAAVAQDSDFALAHYLLGDLLWYVDQEHRAEEHLRRAFALSVRLPVREQLLVRARYTQLVLDRPDSALRYWRALRAAYPRDALGYEGAVWADLAIGAYADAAAAADSALRLDSTAAPQVRNRMLALLALGDTTRALVLTRDAGKRWPYLEQQTLVARFLMRGDVGGLHRFLDSLAPPIVNGRLNPEIAPTRQALLLSLGRLHDAASFGDVVVATLHAQFAMRAELFQARAELALGDSAGRARGLLHAAVRRLDIADLSPPATARLAELAAGVAAAAGDRSTIGQLRRIVAKRDAGRQLRSHVLAQLTIDAADAFVRGDYDRAVRLLDRTRPGMFFGRSPGALAILEADALRSLGDSARADSLDHLVSAPLGLHDDGEVWLSLRPVAVMALQSSIRVAQPRISEVLDDFDNPGFRHLKMLNLPFHVLRRRFGR